MHSYWENKQWFKEIDFAILGSGIVGINCALRLRKEYPQAKITIFESGYLPSGASSKNAGFACFGSPSEILSDLQFMNPEEVFNLVEKRLHGLEKLKKTCGIVQLDFQQNGGYELFTKEQGELFENCSNQLSELNKMLKPIFKEDCFVHMNESIRNFGFKKVENIILNKFEGQIDTGKMIKTLISICKEKNIEIINGMEILDFDDEGENVKITSHNKFQFCVKKLFVATNGFANKLIPELDLKPARAQVLITKPIKQLKIKGTFHMEEGYYYFRNIDNRILLGGGRNLDIIGETTTEQGTSTVIQEKLKQLLFQQILPDTNFEIDYSWSGIMGVGSIKKPILKKISLNVFCGIRLGGMGVAIGSLVGEELGELLINDL